MPLFSAVGNVNAFKFNEFLPSSFVFTMAQDNQNRIWFATSDWISSFDGYSIRNLKKPEQASQFRPVINKLFFDHTGNLWIATLQGLFFYDIKNGEYQFILFENSDLLHKSNIIYDITEDKNNTLYFATRNGIYSLKGKDATPTRLSSFAYHETFNGKTKSERIARCLLFDNQGYLWVGTEGNGLLKISMRDNSCERFSQNDQRVVALPSDFVESLHEDILGMIWVGTTNGVVMFDPAKSQFHKIPLTKDVLSAITVHSISSDNRGNVFIGTNNGLYVYERNSKRISRFENNPFDNNSLSSNYIKYLFKDRSNALWICTQRGLSLYEESPEFNLYQRVSHDSTSLISNQIQFLTGDTVRNRLYVGTKRNGLSVFNPETGTFKNIEWGKERSMCLHYKAMLCSFLTSKGELLIGTENGLLTYTPERGFKESEYQSLIRPLGNEIYAIQEDSLGNFYLSILDKGLFYLNTQNRTLKKIELVNEQPHKDIYTNIKVLHKDYKGRIWVVFRQGGLVCYDPFTQQSVHYHKEDYPLLNSNTIWSLLETRKHHLLIGTINGISVFDLEEGRFVTSKPLIELENHVIFGMLEDVRNDALWIATDNGIFRYKRKSGDLILFSERDNLQGATFNYQSSVILNKSLFFGGDNGLNETDLSVKIENSYLADPQVVGVKIGGRSVLLKDFGFKDGVWQIGIERNQPLEISVSAFSFQKMWRNNYRYMLVGLDSVTHYVLKGTNNIVLPKLPRGRYKLMLSASNSAGNWSNPKEVAEIRVSFPKNTTILLLFGGAVALAILIVLFFLRKDRFRNFSNVMIKEDKAQEAAPLPEMMESVQPDVDERTEALLARLDEIMEKETPYLNKRFSKTQLAGMMRITEPQLSQLLKDYRGKGYTDYINEYRVEYFKKMIAEESFKDYTLLSIGIECGFNSKTSFYRVFKSFTGLTPSEYIDRLKASAGKE
ncbi:MAG: two-component regulator propeller domain-containing protein [Bacteroidales bacterium]